MNRAPSRERRSRATELVIAADSSADSAQSPPELLPLVYDELRGLAGAYLARERVGHTLQPTALVHEAYLRLIDQSRVEWRGRLHFLAVGAQMMRRILVDHARRRKREKRGGDRKRVTLSGNLFEEQLDLEQLVDLDQALTRLAELDPRQARVVELRYFAGLDVQEAARFLGVAKRTVEGDWTHARAWLRRELS